MNTIINDILYWLGIISEIFGIISGLNLLFQYFYNRKIGFYLCINKIFLGDREVHFKLSSSFKFSNSFELFKKFNEVLHESQEKYETVVNSKNHKMYNIRNGIILDIQCQDPIDDTDLKDVFIQVIDAGVTLRTGLDIISLFGNLIPKLGNKLNISDQDYNFQVLYDNRKNPFIGMKLKAFSNDNIKTFQCKLNYYALLPNQYKGANKTIDINKSNLSLNDENYTNLSEAAKILLAV